MTTTVLAPATAGKTLENTLTFGTMNISILLTGENTGGAFSLMETVARPGTEPPYHMHQREDEIFYITEGHVSVMVDGVVHECFSGQAIFLPRGVPHTFRIRSEIARAVLVVTPAGFEKYFQAVGKPATSFDPPTERMPAADYQEIVGRAAAASGVIMMPVQPQF